MVTLFNGEKTSLYWVGLIIVGFASLVLFASVWQFIVSYMNYLSYSSLHPSTYYYFQSYVPIIVGGIIFMLIGLYMMKSGAKKEQLSNPKQT